jgi:restriction system protein
MYGVMTAKHAHGVIIITSGLFTQEAKNFADDKPIDLVEGNQLAVLIGSVQSKPVSVSTVNLTANSPEWCPVCGAVLTLRTARKGKNPGTKFWGCSKYPACKFTKAYEA